MSLVIDNPKLNNAKNYFANINKTLVNNSKSNLPNNSMNLRNPMISRVYKAKQGCSACGK